MTTRIVTITITTNPLDTAIIALEMRRFLMRNTPAFVWDNCGPGTNERPREIEAIFPAVREAVGVVRETISPALASVEGVGISQNRGRDV